MYICRKIICFGILFFALNLYAQKEGYNWVFGENSGITFNTIPPTYVSNRQIYRDGSSCISSKEGKLLFYSNGETVWDSSNSIMLNGTSLNGYKSFYQTSIIVPKPNSNNLYYIFTTDYFGLSKGLQYSEVNMTLNSGLGRVIKKNSLINTPVCSSITAVGHANQKDFWVLVRGFGNDLVYSYLVTENGVNTTPVISSTGITITLGRHSDGAFKVSPDGSKIAATHDQKDTSFVADFDKLTGKISSVWKFYTGKSFGLEFSENSNCLYISDYNSRKLLQYDLTRTTENDFIYSRFVVDSAIFILNLQVGPDGKIYFCSPDSLHLNVIHAPDSMGYNCRLQKKYIKLGSNKVQGVLPNFIQSFFYEKAFNYTRNCLYDSTLFSIIETDNLDSVKWDFGDPGSGVLNYSDKISDVFHIFNQVGIYKVTLHSFYKGYNDDYSVYVYVNDPKPILGNDTSFCNAVNLGIKPHNDYLKYRWNTNDTIKSIFPKHSGTYILTALDSAGCYSRDTINIQLHQVKADFGISDSVVCKNNVFYATDTSLFDNNSRMHTYWYCNDKNIQGDLNISVQFIDTGLQAIKMIVESDSNCIDSLTKWVQVKPNSNISFEINQLNQCLNGNLFDFKFSAILNSSNISSYQWLLGDGSNDDNQDVLHKVYSKDSIYEVTLIATNNVNCSDTVSKFITVRPNPKASFNINQLEQCFNNNLFNFENTSTLKSGSFDSLYWNLGDNNSFSDFDIKHQYQTADSFHVLLKVFSDNGCMDSAISKVAVHPTPIADIQILKDSMCLDNDIVSIINSSHISTGTLTHRWDFGDGTTDTSRTPQNKKYNNTGGIRTVQYVVSSGMNCNDTFEQNIQLLDRPKANFTINDSAQCLNAHSFDFNNASVQGDGTTASKWVLDDVDEHLSTDLGNISFGRSGSHKITLILESEFTCKDTATQFVYLENSKTTEILKLSADSQCLKGNLFSLDLKTNDNQVQLNFFQWRTDDGNTYNTQKINHSYKDTGAYSVVLVTQSANACWDTAHIEIVVLPHPKSNFSAEPVCFLEPVLFRNTSELSWGNIATYKWSFGDGSHSVQKEPIKYYSSAGTYDITLESTSEFGCADTLILQGNAIVKEKPSAKFNYIILASDDFELTVLKMNNQSSNDVVSNYWDFGNGNSSKDKDPTERFVDTNSRRITLTVTNSNNCKDQFTLNTGTLYKPFYFHLPCAFSPNGDNVNEVFRPVSSPYISRFSMEISNRWGELGYQSDDIQKGWDGTFMGEACPQGVYICRIYYIPLNGRPSSLKLSVTLLR